jgi:hypothetical protein
LSARKRFPDVAISFSQRQACRGSYIFRFGMKFLEVVAEPQNPLRDRFVLEYGGLADDGMIQLQVTIHSEHPRLIRTVTQTAIFALIEHHRLGLLACCFPVAGCGYQVSWIFIRRSHATESLCSYGNDRHKQMTCSIVRTFVGLRLLSISRGALWREPCEEHHQECQNRSSLLPVSTNSDWVERLQDLRH